MEKQHDFRKEGHGGAKRLDLGLEIRNKLDRFKNNKCFFCIRDNDSAYYEFS